MSDTTQQLPNLLNQLDTLSASDIDGEQLFDVVLDMFRSSAIANSSEQTGLCEDVMTQLISIVEMEAKQRISKKVAVQDDAPRRIIRTLAIDNICVAEPVLTHSKVLQDDDLLMVTRVCGPQHLAAMADRGEISKPVTNELIRLGDNDVWERVARNKGAEIGEKATSFLIKRARENPEIQLELMDRTDLSEQHIREVIAEAGDAVREKLVQRGRSDLISMLRKAEDAVTTKVLSTGSILSPEYARTYTRVVQHKQKNGLNQADLMTAVEKQDFPLVASIFAVLSGLTLEDAVHWLTRRELDPTLIAFRALGFNRNLVEKLLNSATWGRILTPATRAKALHNFDNLKTDVAKRLFEARRNAAA